MKRRLIVVVCAPLYALFTSCMADGQEEPAPVVERSALSTGDRYDDLTYEPGDEDGAAIDAVLDCLTSCEDKKTALAGIVEPHSVLVHEEKIEATAVRCAERFVALSDADQETLLAQAGDRLAACRPCADKCGDATTTLVNVCAAFVGDPEACGAVGKQLAEACVETGCSSLPARCHEGCDEVVTAFLAVCPAYLPPMMCDLAAMLVEGECVDSVCSPLCDEQCWTAQSDAEQACSMADGELPPDPTSMYACLETAAWQGDVCRAGCCDVGCRDALRDDLRDCGDDHRCARDARRDGIACTEGCPEPPPAPVCGDGVCNERYREGCPEDCPVVCGDGICEPSEAQSCLPDCGTCLVPEECVLAWQEAANTQCGAAQEPQCLLDTAYDVMLPCALAACCPAGEVCAEFDRPVCGNAICEVFEDAFCPQDCGGFACNYDGVCDPAMGEGPECPDCSAPPACNYDGVCTPDEDAYCEDCFCNGDGVCQPTEDPYCPDCFACNGDGVCTPDEDPYCEDCICNGDGICQPTEDPYCPDCFVCNGDGVCDPDEHPECPDCVAPPACNFDGVCTPDEDPYCEDCICNRDGVCQATEDPYCPDCFACNDDGVCDPDEAPDCADCFCNGDGVCQPTEDPYCPDCFACNGDGVCDPGEVADCPDCFAPPVCNGDGVCQPDEDPYCPDCFACDGDGVCDPGEHPECLDCFCNGDGVCQATEDPFCPDCYEPPPCNGDGVCQADEDPACPDCLCNGDGVCQPTEDPFCPDCMVCDGDGVCDPGEGAGCPDCETPPMCDGDGVCDPGEAPYCDDCFCNGDGVCQTTEDPFCPDCFACNGDGICDATEDPTTCPDCMCNGDGVCEPWETPDVCPAGC